jgi:UDP-GlcNAc:undecaprenyl-phosphate GlcNAc-1-phosphate transferase
LNLRTALVSSAAAGFAAGLTLVVTEPVRRVALHFGLTDRPAPHKAHAYPTPYLGGVALALGCLLPVAVLVQPWGIDLTLVVTGAAVAATVGLVDDLATLSPGTRLGVEALAAVAVVLGTGRTLPVSGTGWLDTVLTVSWVVVLTNSYNLLDNMDGAAASVGAGTAGVLGVGALIAGRNSVGVLLLCLAGGCLGFLAHNRPPARIFMGDAGSLFIGFVVATTALLATPPGRVSAYAALLLVTFVATVDTTLVVIHRHRNRRSWFSGGTDHASHRLRQLGLGPGRVAAVQFLIAAGSSGLGVLVAAREIPGWPALGAVCVAAAGLVSLLLKVPGHEISGSATAVQ